MKNDLKRKLFDRLNVNAYWKWRYVPFVLFLFFVCPLKGQEVACTCFIEGVVRDQHSHLPIPGATVLIEGQDRGVFTDEKGKYKFSGLCPGKYVLESRIVGYQSVKQSVDLKIGHQEDFDLTEDEVHLHAVEINAHRTSVPGSLPVSSLEGSDLAQTRGQSLGESLKGIAGVSTLQTGSSIVKPVIHGLHSNRILILNNGVRQEGQQWGSEHAPEIDPFVAQRVSVVKGATGVRYGSDAIGGVILVEPEELPFGKSMSGELTAAGFSNGRQGAVSGTLQGGLKRFEGWGWRLQGTLKRGGNVRTPNYFLDNTGILERNFSVGLGYRKKGLGIDVFYSRFTTRLGIFSGSHIGSVADLLEVIKNGEPLVKSGFSYSIGRPFQNVTHDLMKAEAYYHFADGNRIQWVFGRQFNDRSEYDLHRPRNDSLAALNRPELNFKLTTLTNDLIWDHKPLFGKLSGQFGISTLYQYNLMSGRPLIPNFDQLSVGAFWIEHYVSKGWELESGVRYDDRRLTVYRIVSKEKVTDTFQFGNFSGNLGVSRSFNERLAARFNLSTAWRAPNVSELFSNGVHHGAAAFEEGDVTLKPEQAYNSILSIVYSGAWLKLEVGGYLNYINRFIYLKPQAEPILTFRGAFPYFKYTQTNARFTGVDMTVTGNLGNGFSITSKVGYLRAYDTKNDSYLVMIPPSRWENQLKYEIGEWGKFRKVFAQIGNIWVMEQKRVPPNSDYLAPPGAYSLWSAQLGMSVPLAKKHSLEVSLAGQNLLDTVYRDYMNRFRYYADEMGRTVSLRLRWRMGALD